MVPSSRARPPLQALDLMMKLTVVFALSWFLYASYTNRSSPPAPELQRAVQLLKQGDATQARLQFDHFLAARPDNAAAYAQVCLLCQEARRFDLMADYAQRGHRACAKADSSERAQLLALLAIALSESGKAQTLSADAATREKQTLPARAAAREAQILDPYNPLILNEAGYVLADTSTKIEDLNDAETWIVRALKTLPGGIGSEDPSGLLALVEGSYGWVLYKKGLSSPPGQAEGYFAQAVTALLQATVDLPSDVDQESAKTIYYHLGAAYRRAGQLDAARDAIAVALRYDPQYPEVLAEQHLLTPTPPPSHPALSNPTTAHAFTPLQTSPADSQINL